MVLTIKAISYKGQPLKSPIEALFDEQGGTLGRLSGNHLVLMDNEKIVSGEHATITYENGHYYYIDTSLNGTHITNRDQRIRHEKIRLNDDDTLRVGEYQLVLSISGKAAHRSSDRSQPAQDQLSLSMFGGDGRGNPESLISDILENDMSDFDQKNSSDEASPPQSAYSNDRGASIGDSFVPPEPIGPEPQAENSVLPDDLTLDDFFGADGASRINATGGEGFKMPLLEKEHPKTRSNPWEGDRDEFSGLIERSASLGSEPEQMPQAPTASGQPEMAIKNSRLDPGEVSNELLREFFEAAGVEETAALSREEYLKLMRSVGSMLRELIDGLMTVLRGRSELKSELRASMTTLKPAENNPLKFSPTVEEALKTCLLNNSPGFIDAIDAIHEGYEDLKNHQLAITAGIQASLVDILKRFDPQRFSDKFKDGLVLQKKAKCWDEYRNAYRNIVEETMEDFFGEVFVRAYEKQIDKLRSRQK